MTPIDVSHNLVVMNLLQSRLRPHPNAPVVLKPQDRNLTYQKQRRVCIMRGGSPSLHLNVYNSKM